MTSSPEILYTQVEPNPPPPLHAYMIVHVLVYLHVQEYKQILAGGDRITFLFNVGSYYHLTPPPIL